MERLTFDVDDDEGSHLNATWSRSGRRLVITVHRSHGHHEQIALTPAQVAELAAYLAGAGRT